MVSASHIARDSARLALLTFACLTLATCGGGGGDGGSGPATPQIALSDQTIIFAGLVGGADPATQTVAVTNGGGGVLGGLSATVSYGASEPTGWLNASLDNSSAPSTLTLSAATGALAVGSYSATVEIASAVATNSPRNVNVTFTITTVPITAPAAPTTLAATAASNTQVNLTWADNANSETGFRIERCTGTTCTNFVEITTVGANESAYSDGGLSASTGYNYRVRAYNGAGTSAYSNTSAATTLAAPVAPPAPTVLTATAASSSQINLSWTDNASNETGFLIERCTGAGCVNFVEFASTVTNVTTYQSTGLAASTVYTYRVRAWNATGTSAYSNSSAATTLAPAVTPPAAPSNLTATTVSTTVIDIGWTDNSSNETGFYLEQCSGAACTNFTQIADIPANAVLVNNSSLAAGTIYRYRVRAYNSGGTSTYSNIAQATTETATTFIVQYDNMVAKSTADAAVQTTVYPNAENAVGWNYYYTGGTFTNYLATASLMRFDVLAQISGKTIVEAKLLMVERYAPGDQLGSFKIAALAQTWNPATMTWNVFESAAVSWYTASQVTFFASSTTTVSAREFNITAIVQNWANGTWANNGLVLYDDAPSLPPFASYQIMGFNSLELYNNTSQRPQLYIRYR